MFEDIHALVEFAEAGSIARAASRVHRTPSAITRQMQRLEAELGAQLLDRSVKPPRFVVDIVATDRMVIVEKGRSRGARTRTWQAMSASQWVLNPPGCLLRAALLGILDNAGPPATIAAEIHNMHLQLALIKVGYGLGLLPERFVRRYAGGAIRMIKPKDLDLQMTIAIVRAGPLG